MRPSSELENGTNGGFEGDVRNRFATDEEGGAFDVREA